MHPGCDRDLGPGQGVRRTRAVDGVDLHVPGGLVYGLLGPNGAGKTTTIRVLATLLRPDGGMARVFGHDVVREADAVRARVRLTGQFASVDARPHRTREPRPARPAARLLPARRQGAGGASCCDAFGLADAGQAVR